MLFLSDARPGTHGDPERIEVIGVSRKARWKLCRVARLAIHKEGLMKHPTVLFMLVTLLCTAPAYSQGIAPNIRIHPNPAMQQFETSIATNPENPNVVLAAAVTQDTAGDLLQGTMGWYCTTDGGVTWSGRDTLPTHTNLSDWMGDPAVGIDLSGNFFVSGIYNDQYIFIDRSTDSGKTWKHTATSLTSGHTPNLAVDLSPPSPLQGHLYLVNAGANFARSTDTGQSWSTPVSIGGTIGNWLKGFPKIAGGPFGHLYVTWAGYDAASSAPVRLGFNRSTDGGLSWDTARSIRTYNGVYGQGAIKGTQIYSGPSIDVDRGSDSRGSWIYIVYAEKNPIAPDIFLVRSTDFGDSWSNPVKVNQDTSGKDHWMPSIAVDPTTGYVFVVYYDSRNFAANDSAQVYISTSGDGGKTFEDKLVSDSPFKPAPVKASWDNDYMGQYIGIAALNSVVWPCWMDNRTGFHQVYTARIRDSLLILTTVRNVIGGTAPQAFVLYQNYPNPFNPSTTIRYSIPHSEFVTLRIFNVLGEQITTLVSEKVFAGTHQIEWNVEELPSGVYFYRLEAGGFLQTKKFLLLR